MPEEKDLENYDYGIKPNSLLYKDIEKKILGAIDEGFCTISRMKKHGEIPLADDISAVLDGMCIDQKIVRCDNGTITAYFRKKRVPARFWLDGTGRVVGEFTESDTDFTDLKIERQKALDAQNLQLIAENEQIKNFKPRTNFKKPEPVVRAPFSPNNHEIEPQTELKQVIENLEEKSMNAATETERSTEVPAKQLIATLQKGIVYTAEMFEQFGKEQLSISQMARRLGVVDGSIKWQLKKPELQAAYNCGRGISPNAIIPTPPSPKRQAQFTEEFFENCGAAKMTQKQMAESLGVSGATISRQMANDNFAEAYLRGVQSLVGENYEKSPKQGKKNIEWTCEMMQSLAFNHGNINRPAKAMDVGYGSITYQFKQRPELEKAWNKGVSDRYKVVSDNYKEVVEEILELPETIVEVTASDELLEIAPQPVESHLVGNSRITNTLDHIGKKEITVNQVEEFSFSQNPSNFVQSELLVQKPSASVKLGSGSLEFIFSGNLFEMDPAERYFLMNIIDQVQEFKENSEAR